MNCADNDGTIKSRIGGPDACIVKPHSIPWIAKLILSDLGTIVSSLLDASAKIQFEFDKIATAQFINNYEKSVRKWNI